MSVVIGLCAPLDNARWGPFAKQAAVVARSYLDSIQATGALAILLPPDDAAAQRPDELLDLLDGLLLAGGADIDPGSYGAKPDPKLEETWPERDRFELALTHRALQRGLPVLGICRGMQVLNVTLGGTLIQHLPDVVDSDLHRSEPGVFHAHDVTLKAGSLAADAVGSEHAAIPSHHHQGVGELGDGLTITAHADADGVTEAIELPGPRFALGVQWHPEEDARDAVFGAFADAARRGPRPPLPTIVQAG